jgi:hypothetical protein
MAVFWPWRARVPLCVPQSLILIIPQLIDNQDLAFRRDYPHPQKALGHIAPIQALKNWQEPHP